MPLSLSDSLPPHDLVIWTDCSFPFPFGKSGSGILANCSLVRLSPLFPFQQAQFAKVFPLKPVRFCNLFASFGSTKKSATSLLLSDSALSSSFCSLVCLSFYLNFGRCGRNCLLSSRSGYSGSADTRFSPRTTRLMSWPDGERYTCPMQSLVVSLSLISRVHSCLFLDWRRTVSCKFFDAQVPLISPEERVLPCHARCVVSRLCCKEFGLLLNFLSSIENPSCCACGHLTQNTSHSILHCPATDSLRRSFFYDSASLRPLVWGLVVSRFLGLHGYTPCPHPSEGIGKQSQPSSRNRASSSCFYITWFLRCEQIGDSDVRT